MEWKDYIESDVIKNLRELVSERGKDVDQQLYDTLSDPIWECFEKHRYVVNDDDSVKFSIEVPSPEVGRTGFESKNKDLAEPVIKRALEECDVKLLSFDFTPIDYHTMRIDMLGMPKDHNIKICRVKNDLYQMVEGIVPLLHEAINEYKRGNTKYICSDTLKVDLEGMVFEGNLCADRVADDIRKLLMECMFGEGYYGNKQLVITSFRLTNKHLVLGFNIQR